MINKHGNEIVLEVDHIEELQHNPRRALDITNLRTLCNDCHSKRHKRFRYRQSKKKKKWDDEWF